MHGKIIEAVKHCFLKGIAIKKTKNVLKKVEPIARGFVIVMLVMWTAGIAAAVLGIGDLEAKRLVLHPGIATAIALATLAAMLLPENRDRLL